MDDPDRVILRFVSVFTDISKCNLQCTLQKFKKVSTGLLCCDESIARHSTCRGKKRRGMPQTCDPVRLNLPRQAEKEGLIWPV